MKVEYSKGNRASKELILLNRQSFEASSGRKMKVMLIFPPDWFPSEPYLSLPSLTAVLRQAGHTVIQKDINLEMWDWYFSEDFLKKVLRRVPQQLDRLRKIRVRSEEIEVARRERIPDEVKALVWERDDGRCVRCGAEHDLQFDHVIPVAKGGGVNVENIQVLCGDCNRAKSASIV